MAGGDTLTRFRRIRGGFVANLAEEVLKGQPPLSRRELRGEGVELSGHREALLDPVFQLLFSQHVHQLDANESGLRRVERFEPPAWDASPA